MIPKNKTKLRSGEVPRSRKHVILEYIFFKRTQNGTTHLGEDLVFTLQDILEGYKACHLPRPVSSSNFILDLTRQDRGIESRRGFCRRL